MRRGIQAIYRILPLVGLAQLGPISACPASTWRPPIRPLKLEEQFEFAASSSDAVALGAVTAVHDSTDKGGLAWQWMDFRLSAWLKGDPGSKPLRVYFPQVSHLTVENARDHAVRATASCLAFLHHAHSATADYWVVLEHPDFPGSGLLFDVTADSGAAKAAASAIRSLQPESLAAHADRIVLGQLSPSPSPITYRGSSLKCTQVAIEPDVAGSGYEATIRVYGPYGALSATGRHIVMLKRGEGGAYEQLGFNAGVIPVAGDSVPSAHCSLATFLERLRAARRTKTPPPR
jgi:hypothetical protein